ncbi:MAG: hypothetical protein R1F52_03480 [Candidatus Nitrosoabyssus spongiisocia]|nr:MAG: hypothetical protein R1F52_03480 [Nitrosopumilaceae archaeon AB1(1)]
MTQKKFDKAKKSRNSLILIASVGAIFYIIYTALFSLLPNISTDEILLSSSLALAIGLFFVIIALILNFETTKELIKIDDKLDEINKKLSKKN